MTTWNVEPWAAHSCVSAVVGPLALLCCKMVRNGQKPSLLCMLRLSFQVSVPEES